MLTEKTREDQAVTKDLTSSSKFSGSCVLTLQPLHRLTSNRLCGCNQKMTSWTGRRSGIYRPTRIREGQNLEAQSSLLSPDNASRYNPDMPAVREEVSSFCRHIDYITNLEFSYLSRRLLQPFNVVLTGERILKVTKKSGNRGRCNLQAANVGNNLLGSGLNFWIQFLLQLPTY